MTDKLHRDLDEIKADVKTLLVNQAVDHEILKQHEQRSTQLEVRVLPLEDDLKFRSKMWGLAIKAGGLILAGVGAVKAPWADWLSALLK